MYACTLVPLGIPPFVIAHQPCGRDGLLMGARAAELVGWREMEGRTALPRFR